MRRRSDQPEGWDELRNRIIGLGEQSSRKSYYPELMARVRELEETRKSLAELNTFLQTVMDAATEIAVIATNPEGIITLFNRGAEKMLGYRAEEVIGLATPICFQLAAEVTRRVEGLNSTYGISIDGFQVLIESAAREGSEKREWTYVRKDGRQFPVELMVTAIREDGHITGYLVIAEDVSGRKRAEEELNRHREHLEILVEERTAELLLARDAAEAANRAKSIFLANMSHEIRTPMNAVLGFAQLLLRDPSLSSSALYKVATILKSGDHLLAIINDILEMSRIEAGRAELLREPVNMNGLLDDLAVMFRMRAEEKGLALTLDSAPELQRYFMADVGKLRQIMINLLGNAIKFTRQGSISIHALQVGSDRIAIEVHDTGIGITLEEQGKLFRPFERTRSGEQAAGGTGLGLAISREYAHLMGGEITVKSKPGEGSCFRLEFTVAASSEPTHSAGTPRHIIKLAPGQGEIHVLVVDDLIANRELLRDMLEPLGFVVAEASDGREALEKANCGKPRIILMDLVMPDMDGAEATRFMRRTFANDPLTIIGISASAFDTEKQRFFAAGIDAFIAKPFRTQELYDALSQYAGVSFVTGDDKVALENGPSQDIPTLEQMSAEWREAYRQALVRRNITRIRKLGEEAEEVDPRLSVWLLERVARYDLDGLARMNVNEKEGVKQ